VKIGFCIRNGNLPAGSQKQYHLFVLAGYVTVNEVIILKTIFKNIMQCFGGLGVACWPLVPKFAGSNPAEVVGFLGRNNPQHAFLRRGSKAVGLM